VAIWPFILLAILVASSVAVTGGSIGLLSTWKQRGRTWEISFIDIVIGLIPLLFCGLPEIFPKPSPPIPTLRPVYKLADISSVKEVLIGGMSNFV
jgi:hypothetical protein